MSKKINTALISVYHKEGLDEILKVLHRLNVKFISTGGTREFICTKGYECEAVENITSYPAILGGRVKTLHPKIFGGILYRRDTEQDSKQVKSYDIPTIDLVIVDLYPFQSTLASGASEQNIIEKIDIGGISLIRAAAKNFHDVLIVPSKKQYGALIDLLNTKNGISSLEDRKCFAKEAFAVSSQYDSAIFNYFDEGNNTSLRVALDDGKILRYGENPHQKSAYYGNFDAIFTQLHGREISYNNLLDIDAAVSLIADFDETTVAILKHNNACGLASRENITEAWKEALAGDPVSAFGGIVIANRRIDQSTAEEINQIFFEIIIAPAYERDALEILQQKKNRIILQQKNNACETVRTQYRSVLNGMLVQDRDFAAETAENFNISTNRKPTAQEIDDLIFANKLVKHTKSNAIVLAKNKQLIASGTGQTSRVDALNQAIEKARTFKFDLEGAVMASDAFFPFPDCVEIADKAGITAVVQPGGSIKDELSVEYCNAHDMTMVMTGTRHFKH